MKNDPVQLLGHVIMYPYKWRIGQPEEPPPKERTACAVFEHGEASRRMIVLVAISDHQSRGSVELSVEDIKRAGLSGFRKAFVHLDQYNLDLKTNSFTYNPRVKPRGRLSKALTLKIASLLLEGIQSGRSIKITRT